MKITVPLHSIVIVIDNKTNEEIISLGFKPHEIITTENVCLDLVGDSYRSELDVIIKNEVFRRIALKLSLGERVVFLGDLSKEQRIALAKLGKSQGSSVFYLVDNINKQTDEYGKNIKDFVVIHNIDLKTIKQTFAGITVVGDVHGNLESLEKVISWASSSNKFLWFLGDIIDYGQHSIETLEIIYSLVVNGKANCILGNHERKIAKWFQYKENKDNYKFRISEGNKVTIDALNLMSIVDRNIWYGKFRTVIAKSSLIMNLGNVVLTHAAIHPDYWKNSKSPDIENYALYGEQDFSALPDFKLSYKWIDYIPKDCIVLVGHEAQGQLYPLTANNDRGGKVVFLDTGSGKGGPLSTADFLFEKDSLHLCNFNRHTGE